MFSFVLTMYHTLFQCFRYIHLVNCHSTPMRYALWLTLFYRWGNWGIKRLDNLFKDIKLISGRVGTWTQTLLPASMPLTTVLYYLCVKSKPPKQHQISPKTSGKNSTFLLLSSLRLSLNWLFLVYLGREIWAHLVTSRSQWGEKQPGRKPKSCSIVIGLLCHQAGRPLLSSILFK